MLAFARGQVLRYDIKLLTCAGDLKSPRIWKIIHSSVSIKVFYGHPFFRPKHLIRDVSWQAFYVAL